MPAPDRRAAARKGAATRAFNALLQRECPWCHVALGAYHKPECGPGYVNFSDDCGRFLPPPTRRQLAWADCGPDPVTMDRARIVSASGEWEVAPAPPLPGQRERRAMGARGRR